jgi:hypothetical protein
MKKRLTSLTLLLAITFAFAPFNTVQAAQATKATSFPVSFTGTTALGQVVNFVGTYTIQKFDIQNGKVVAVGTLAGTVTGAVSGTVSKLSAVIPISAIASQQDCQILHLELGPIDLNLLGLVVHVDKIVIDITAQPGEGNLLGNLLCAIANLFNGGAPLDIVRDLLSSLLDLLNFLR